MTLEEFKEIVIRDGIEEVTREYEDEPYKRDGAIEGFEIARALQTREQFELVLQEREARERHFRDQHMAGNNEQSMEDYWFERWATMQVEWVFNVLIAAAWVKPDEPISARAALKADAILGKVGA